MRLSFCGKALVAVALAAGQLGEALQIKEPSIVGDADEFSVAQVDANADAGIEAEADTEFFGRVMKMFKPAEKQPDKKCPQGPDRNAVKIIVEKEAKKKIAQSKRKNDKAKCKIANKYKKKIQKERLKADEKKHNSLPGPAPPMVIQAPPPPELPCIHQTVQLPPLPPLSRPNVFRPPCPGRLPSYPCEQCFQKPPAIIEQHIAEGCNDCDEFSGYGKAI